VKHKYDLTYISLGAGVQSSALLVCSALGLHGVPKADVAIFADTGVEPGYVYDYLEILKEWSPVPIVVVSKGNLTEWTVDRQKNGKRFVTVPLFTEGGGMLRRQCTREFKIDPIYKEVRRQLGLKPRQRFKGLVRAMLGISIDEVQRMKPSWVAWIDNAFPLVDAGLARGDCLKICEANGLPKPKRSSCVYCPYHGDDIWRDMKQNHPEDWAKAVEFDEAVRDMTMRGRDQPAFVHRSLVPLGDVDLNEDQCELFGEECDGICGV